MDDDEISCQIPENAPGHPPGDKTYCHLLIKLMRLASHNRKRLSSAYAMRQTPDQIVATVREMNKALDELNSPSQRKEDLGGPLDKVRSAHGITLRQAQSLQSHYFSLIFDINRILACPWSRVHAFAAKDSTARVQIETSCGLVAETSRAVIMATKLIQLDASSPTL